MSENGAADVDGTSPDFSSLPDVAWVRILQHLPLQDRARAARTCHALTDAFNHPSLWSTQTLHFLGNDDNFRRKAEAVTASNYYLALTKQFGQYFQHLTIKISGHLRKMAGELQELLIEVAENCRLESLTLDVGRQTSQFHTNYGFPPDTESIRVLAAFVRHAFRMKHLNIRSWPMFEGIITKDECNIFKALKSNEKLKKNLEKLTIFWLDEVTWSERRPILLSPEDSLDLVCNFRNLTTLGLRSPMISNELLISLADRTRRKLENLKIVVHFINDSKFQVPRVTPKTWQSLIDRNPNLRVEVLVFLATPDFELANLLPPEVPVSHFMYMKYSKVDPATLTKLHTQYNTTLTAFHSLCDSYNMDDELILLCERCEYLTDFIYHGEIYVNTVIRLAKLRGNKWQRFELNEANVKIHTEYDDIDDDQVLQRDADGNLVQVGLFRFHAADENQLQTMIVEVSSALGTSWRPRVVR
ncbi:F-box only protein 39-like [Mya arenaria]|uniref:F-box only protein 39-like n=1 Tax=Mya arenaria TaxID=6604 RepID=UPI0022E0848D|nr:F-box only protein 39-like [Mya arenaria]